MFTKVPGRMGMIITLYLISANVYISVEAPHPRDFGLIDIWMIGTQIPILLAVCEYGFILFLKKTHKKEANQIKSIRVEDSKSKLDKRIEKLDFATMIFSFLYFIIFATFYCIFAPIQ